MDSDHALVLFFGLVLVGAAVALAYSSPAVFGGESDGIGGASLTSFETTDVYCGDPNSTSGSTFTHDVRGGQALVLNESIPVATNDTTVSASLDEFGPQRYMLTVTRETPEDTPTETPGDTPTATPTETPIPDADTPTATPGNGTETGSTNATATDGENATRAANETATEPPTATAQATPTPTATDAGSECHPEVRYNATIQLAQPDEYTVIVTYDGEFAAAYWQEGSNDGSYDTIPDRPETATGGNETAATIGLRAPT